MAEITSWEEVLEEFSDVVVKFDSYYKYVFEYRGKTEDVRMLSVGSAGMQMTYIA
ncbi:MAG: hypothetical protein ACXQTM_08325 [Methanosarcinales archaeon]